MGMCAVQVCFIAVSFCVGSGLGRRLGSVVSAYGIYLLGSW